MRNLLSRSRLFIPHVEGLLLNVFWKLNKKTLELHCYSERKGFFVDEMEKKCWLE